MFGEQETIVPIFTPYPTRNPNPNLLPSHSVLISEPIVRSSGTDSYSHGSDGLQARAAFEVDNAAALRSGIISQTTDATTYEHAGGTLSEATKVSTVMHSSGNFGVVTQHVVNSVIVATRQPENFQPVQCEVCNVTCNSGDVLERHKQGKRHFKNLQKLAISSVIAPNIPPPVASATIVGELENKKHKLLQNGASVDTLIYCDICNVVCNNQDVFRRHLAGKKHSAKATIQLANMNGLSNPTSECSPEVQPSNGSSQKKPETLQSARCDLCKISCTSNEILSIHITGKKHLKKLKESEKIPYPSLIPIASLETPPTEPMEKNPESTEGKVDLKKLTESEKIPYPSLTPIASLWTPPTNPMEKNPMGKVVPDPSLTPIASLWTPPTDPMEKNPMGKVVPDPSLTPIASLWPPPTEPMEKNPEGKVVNSPEGKSAWCELCGINCNTYDVLKSHISGKKHQKNLEKSEKPIGPNPPAPATEPAATPMIGLLQNSPKEEGKVLSVDGTSRKAKRVGSHEDMETKKQKVLQGGAASGALRTCTVCNVVCNSPTVFLSHLAGQKHAAMAVKHAETG